MDIYYLSMLVNRRLTKEYNRDVPNWQTVTQYMQILHKLERYEAQG